MDNIYEALRESHELRIELAAHAAAKERFLCAPILLDDLASNLPGTPCPNTTTVAS